MRTKRRRGGQPGNQNARTHGCYSSRLSPEEAAQVQQLMDAGNTERSLAILRVRLQNVLLDHAHNPRLAREACADMATWLRLKLNLNDEDAAYARKAVKDTFDIIKNTLLAIPETIEAELKNRPGTNQADSKIHPETNLPQIVSNLTYNE